MRVTLLTTDVSPTTGLGTVLSELAHGLAQRPDVHLQVLAMRTTPHRGPLPDGVDVRYVLPRWTPTFRWRPHKLWPMLFPGVELPPTDVLHAVVEFPYAILAQRLARRRGMPYVVSIHGRYGAVPFGHWENRALYRRAIRSAAAVTSCSRFAAEALQRASGINRAVEVVGNPVDYARFQAPADGAAVRRRFRIPESARVILGVGALKPVKGFDGLLRAFARLATEEPDTALVIAGGGDAAAYHTLAQALGVAGRVHLVGAAGGADLVGLYQTCEVFAHLPRYEGFGIVYLEAAACGKPTVGARVAGVPEAVRDGETGLLVGEGDTEGAAAALLRLLRDRALAERLGAAGRAWAQAHSRERFTERIERIYHRIVDGRGSVRDER
jgi:glycosyltransferase involved in cell wall biosynthesis